jgi:imidazolonepropionase-like amidohydrolase
VIGDTPLVAPGLTRTFSDEALAEAARRVHAAGGRIAVHCADREVIQGAINAGFDSLEHASFLQVDQLAEMAARGIAWVPTRSIEPGIRGLAREMRFPSVVVRQFDDGFDGQPAVLRAAVEAGVTVLAGTDAGMGPHGMIRHEVELLLEAGLSPDVALGAASWIARAWLGLPGIAEGAPADLVAYRDDPRGDPGILGRPALVMLDGAVLPEPRGQ